MPEFDFAPKMFTDLLPANLKAYASYILAGSACIIVFFLLLFLLTTVKFLFGGRKGKGKMPNLDEDLTEYPDLKKTSGDRQLRAEGTPVRLRLVVIAPAGASEAEVDELPELFEKLLTGLGEIFEYDKPRVKVWPKQTSYKGFASFFHARMQTGGDEGEQTRWVLIAGRVQIDKRQFMLGLALQSIKPNSVGRRTIDAHEWINVLRVRVRE
ncbi:MAG: hypothetical protein EXS16_01990 [Gemmataceae bacterium]|nr:hypothetical protein [Gemmataceae bacterium]